MQPFGWPDILRTLFLVAEMLPSVVEAVKCFSCASHEYGQLIANWKNANSVTGPQFNRYCDTEDSVQTRAPVEDCKASCLTIYEPHYFGGLQSRDRPYTYIRGCAEKIFQTGSREHRENSLRPREIDFLHVDPICLHLHLTQIFPTVQANERVLVCSCTEDGCNYHTHPASSSSNPSFLFFSFLLFYRLLP